MNYIFVDKIIELEKGRRIRTVKNISLTEDYLDRFYPRLTAVPNSIFIEAMASTAALLLFETTLYKSFAVLAMIENAVFKPLTQGGDRLMVDAELLALHEKAARFKAKIRVLDKMTANAILVLGLFELESLRDPQMIDHFKLLLSTTKKIMGSSEKRA